MRPAKVNREKLKEIRQQLRPRQEHRPRSKVKMGELLQKV
jgi:hypothetical protein